MIKGNDQRGGRERGIQERGELLGNPGLRDCNRFVHRECTIGSEITRSQAQNASRRENQGTESHMVRKVERVRERDKNMERGGGDCLKDVEAPEQHLIQRSAWKLTLNSMPLHATEIHSKRREEDGADEGQPPHRTTDAVRLLAQLAGNVLAAISAHPNYGANIDTETRLLYIHGAYETLTILKVAEAFLRKNGYPILPLQELQTLFKAFRESLLLYHWSPEVHALFAVNPQFGENALLMSREHAEGQPIVEILGNMTVQDQIAGSPHEHQTSVGSGVKRLGRTVFSVPTTPVNPSGRALYMLRGSSGIKFQTHVTDPAYTTPEVEEFAANLAVQVNMFAQELEHSIRKLLMASSHLKAGAFL
ncbi:hypothetical protein BDZ89DRAFT_1034360 [Hymenopellis radicata]|nr:hypothetical protein BDZ89DRAFT_1034360 [Hymenopellis radicata]